MEQQLIYAGIGSRESPKPILALMRRMGSRLAELGYVLRSGAADGADAAFEAGCDDVGGRKEIWLPWAGFNGHADTGFYPRETHFELAQPLHPWWERLTDGERRLHARNMGQVLGVDLATPVSFVLCWTPDGCDSHETRSKQTGGTGMAISAASKRGIPVFNLAQPGVFAKFGAYVAGLRRFHEDGVAPAEGEVFVFGSNLAGRHGKGAALAAKEKYGAVPGVGRGRMGQSYAVPTKENGPISPVTGKPELVTRSLEDIAQDVEGFIRYARQNLSERFLVTRVACVLAGYSDAQIAPLFARAPYNCSLPLPWKALLQKKPAIEVTLVAPPVEMAEPINIWSGAPGLGGALTNMSERAKEKGFIRNSYPVEVNGVKYPDSEAAYQALKVQGAEEYNDGLMIDLICLKFTQNPRLLELVTSRGGVEWLEKCSHFTQAKSPRAQSWEGQGYGSRFISNLVHGYRKALTGKGPATRVVHVKEAPYDVYIGRRMGLDISESIWHNPYRVGTDGTLEQVVAAYAEYIEQKPELLAQVKSLKGVTLGCWCKSRGNLDSGCHGDVLAALAEGRTWVPPTAVQGSLF